MPCAEVPKMLHTPPPIMQELRDEAMEAGDLSSLSRDRLLLPVCGGVPCVLLHCRVGTEQPQTNTVRRTSNNLSPEALRDEVRQDGMLRGMRST